MEGDQPGTLWLSTRRWSGTSSCNGGGSSSTNITIITIRPRAGRVWHAYQQQQVRCGLGGSSSGRLGAASQASSSSSRSGHLEYQQREHQKVECSIRNSSAASGAKVGAAVTSAVAAAAAAVATAVTRQVYHKHAHQALLVLLHPKHTTSPLYRRFDPSRASHTFTPQHAPRCLTVNPNQPHTFHTLSVLRQTAPECEQTLTWKKPLGRYTLGGLEG